MIFISLQPYGLKKLCAFFATVVGLVTASCFASSTFLSVESTPYDNQMNRIRPILLSAKITAAPDLSLSLVNRWMSDLRDIPYGYHLEWKTPSEVQSRMPADCKGKAVALYQRMQSSGAANVRLVIGKRAPTSKITHAWLIWDTEGGSYVLDPTFNWMACRAEQMDERSYVPLYAFAGNKKFRASSGTLIAKN